MSAWSRTPSGWPNPQIAELFEKRVREISEYLRSIFEEKEFDDASVIRNLRITA
jgi:hypothetical protein